MFTSSAILPIYLGKPCLSSLNLAHILLHNPAQITFLVAVREARRGAGQEDAVRGAQLGPPLITQGIPGKMHMHGVTDLSLSLERFDTVWGVNHK